MKQHLFIILFVLLSWTLGVSSAQEVSGASGESLDAKAEKCLQKLARDPDNCDVLGEFIGLYENSDGMAIVCQKLKPMLDMYPDNENIQLVYAMSSLFTQGIDKKEHLDRIWSIACKSEMVNRRGCALAVLGGYFLAERRLEELEKVVACIARDQLLRYDPHLQLVTVKYFKLTNSYTEFLASSIRLIENPDVDGVGNEFIDIMSTFRNCGRAGLWLARQLMESYELRSQGVPVPPEFYAVYAVTCLTNMHDAPVEAKDCIRNLLTRISHVNDLRYEYLDALLMGLSAVLESKEMEFLPEERNFIYDITFECLKMQVEDHFEDAGKMFSLIVLYCARNAPEEAEKLLGRLPADGEQRDRCIAVVVPRIVDVYLKNDDTRKAMKLVEWTEKQLEGEGKGENRRLFYLGMAEIFTAFDNQNQVAIYYEKAYNLDTESDSLANNLAYTLALTGKKLDMANALIEKICEKENVPSYMRDTQAWIRYCRRDYAGAMQAIVKSLWKCLEEANQSEDGEGTTAKRDESGDAEILSHLRIILKANGFKRWSKALVF